MSTEEVIRRFPMSELWWSMWAVWQSSLERAALCRYVTCLRGSLVLYGNWYNGRFSEKFDNHVFTIFCSRAKEKGVLVVAQPISEWLNVVSPGWLQPDRQVVCSFFVCFQHTICEDTVVLMQYIIQIPGQYNLVLTNSELCYRFTEHGDNKGFILYYPVVTTVGTVAEVTMSK